MENINKLNIIKFHIKNLSFGLWEKFKQTFSIQKKNNSHCTVISGRNVNKL